MKQWEYRHLYWGDGIDEDEPDLDALGADGWEVLEFHTTQMPVYGGSTPRAQYSAFMKRERPSPRSSWWREMVPSW